MFVTSHGHRTPGKTSPTYSSWGAMKNRCQSPTSKDWKSYGARGITVCARWQKFENFLADMGKKPKAGFSIERRDVNGNYEPGNCIWATPQVQSENRRNTKRIEYAGKTQTEAAWAREYGISRGRLHYRLEQLGMPMEQALKKDCLPKHPSSKKAG